MDDRHEKTNFVDPDWEVITADLVHDMAQQYMLHSMKIPQSIIAKLSSYERSLGDAAHKNFAIIDELGVRSPPSVVVACHSCRRLCGT